MVYYRIQWISLLTDYKGHGSWSQEVDPDYIDKLNEEYRDTIHHWIVSSGT